MLWLEPKRWQTSSINFCHIQLIYKIIHFVIFPLAEIMLSLLPHLCFFSWFSHSHPQYGALLSVAVTCWYWWQSYPCGDIYFPIPSNPPSPPIPPPSPPIGFLSPLLSKKSNLPPFLSPLELKAHFVLIRNESVIASWVMPSLRNITYSHMLRIDIAGVHLKVTVVVAVILNTVSVSVLVTA